MGQKWYMWRGIIDGIDGFSGVSGKDLVLLGHFKVHLGVFWCTLGFRGERVVRNVIDDIVTGLPLT